jgi:hypothetical protein
VNQISLLRARWIQSLKIEGPCRRTISSMPPSNRKSAAMIITTIAAASVGVKIRSPWSRAAGRATDRNQFRQCRCQATSAAGTDRGVEPRRGRARDTQAPVNDRALPILRRLAESEGLGRGSRDATPGHRGSGGQGRSSRGARPHVAVPGTRHSVFERCDDSSGTVIGVFHAACSHLGKMATAVMPDAKGLAERVFNVHREMQAS